MTTVLTTKNEKREENPFCFVFFHFDSPDFLTDFCTMATLIIQNGLTIENHIFTIRGKQVMLDKDLAVFYQTETRILKQAVNRNPDRFPDDFILKINEIEVELLVSQNVIPEKRHLGGALPYAFTEQGVAMLASVLKTKTAIHKSLI
jgi:hypothetical protein